MTPGDPVVGGTVLRRPAMQSPNYVAGVSGWTINADGSAEFNDVTIRGSIEGTDYAITAAGMFSYSAAPAAGNLTGSAGVSAVGTDAYGNHYLPGQASYEAATATAVQGGIVAWYTGSLSGGWTQQGTIETDGSGDLEMAANGTVILDGTGGNQASGNFNCTADITCSEIDVTGNLITVGGATITETNFNMNPGMGSTSSITTLVSEMTNRGMIT